MHTGPEHQKSNEHGVERRGLQRLSPKTQVALGAIIWFGVVLAAVYALVLGRSIFSHGVDIWWWLVFFATVGVAASAAPVARNLVRAGRATPDAAQTDRRAAPSLRGSFRSHTDRSDSKKQHERQVLEAIERNGTITATRAALETTLMVAEADQILSDLAKAGHLDVQVVGGQLVYSFS